MRFAPDRELILKQIAGAIMPLAVTMMLLYGASFFSRWHWFADLLAQFTYQYLTSAIILMIAFAVLRQTRMALLMAVIAALNLTHTQPRLTWSSDTPSGPILTLLEYNRYHRQITDHSDLKSFMIAHKPDAVVLLEATQALRDMTGTMKDLYPYQVRNDRVGAYGMIVLSRYPIIDHQLIPIHGHSDNDALKVIIKNPGLANPVALYALHTFTPMNDISWQQRNFELDQVAKAISEDRHKNIILTGDLNITPFSPFFEDLVRQSGLNNNYKTLPPVTWPNGTLLPFFQIPIDHILTSKTISLVSRKTYAAMGSDHYPTIAKLEITN